MAKERLSRLQKWILVEAYLKGKRRLHYFNWTEEEFRERGPEWARDKFWIGTKEIHRRFFGSSPNQQRSVILSRSLRRLSEKGFLATRIGGHYYEGERKVVLSELGAAKAKSIIGSITVTDYTIRTEEP
jgi:hypothetical protein